ncbi:MAG: ribonuclease HII [Bacteroidaceae bacterium]|nr:ribonuclease HII [Bacteroidaceae bacterium]MBR1379947.1 ribonuclease HII [Bacteroidaceae bacterium]
MNLKSCYTQGLVEAGLDEAGRGCLAGPVYAAAVILPPDYVNPRLNDSKQLTAHQRNRLREEIQRDAICYAVASCTAQEIDQINILRASILAMHRAVDMLSVRPQALLVDGNRFTPYRDVPHTTIIHGDATYLAIAAASILAKTYRDDYMAHLHLQYPQYHWDRNAGYPTPAHRKAIAEFGLSPYHRVTFRQLPDPQLPLQF